MARLFFLPRTLDLDQPGQAYTRWQRRKVRRTAGAMARRLQRRGNSGTLIMRGGTVAFVFKKEDLFAVAVPLMREAPTSHYITKSAGADRPWLDGVSMTMAWKSAQAMMGDSPMMYITVQGPDSETTTIIYAQGEARQRLIDHAMQHDLSGHAA